MADDNTPLINELKFVENRLKYTAINPVTGIQPPPVWADPGVKQVEIAGGVLGDVHIKRPYPAPPRMPKTMSDTTPPTSTPVGSSTVDDYKTLAMQAAQELCYLEDTQGHKLLTAGAIIDIKGDYHTFDCGLLTVDPNPNMSGKGFDTPLQRKFNGPGPARKT